MKKKEFYKQFGSIATFAVFGTLISICVTGTLLYLYTLTGMSPQVNNK